MNFKQEDVAKYIKNPSLKVKAFLVYGTNEGMIADVSKSLMKSVCADLNDAFKVVNLTAEALEKDIGLLFGEYNARSLLGGRRVILISNATNELTKHLKNLFETSDSDTLIVMTSESLNKKSSLVNFISDSPDCAAVACYDDRDGDIKTFVSKFLIKEGFTIDPNAMETLCLRLSADRKASANELEKLVVYLGTRRHIGLDDVRAAVSDVSASSVEELVFATASGKLLQATDSYLELIKEGTEPVMILRALIYHFERLLELNAGLQKGERTESLISALRPPVMFYLKPDLLLQMRIWNAPRIFEVLDLLYKAEKNCKTTNFPAEETGSYTILQIASAAKKFAR